MKNASFSRRIFAFLIDLFVVSLAVTLVMAAGSAGFFIAPGGLGLMDALVLAGVALTASLFVGLFYFTYPVIRSGATPGKESFGIRVMKTNGGNPGGVRCLFRALFYALSAFPCLGGFLIALLPGGRALHDILSGTRVIEEDP